MPDIDGISHKQARRRGAAVSHLDGEPPEPMDGPRCLAIMYHYVHDTAPLPRSGLPSVPPPIAALTRREFQSQLDRLTQQMEPINWPTLYAWTCGRGSIPDRCFLLTFDDGLRDHTDTVLPILKERNLRGTFFIPGSILASHHLLPAHAIHALLSTLDEETLERELVAYLVDRGKSPARIMGSFDAPKAQALYHYESPARAQLKYLLTMALPIDLRNTALDALFRKHIGEPRRWAEHWYLDWNDLIYMRSEGHTIGGHGFAHEPYVRLTPDQQRRDARRISAALRTGLGSDVRPFSFPYGRFDNDACRACAEAGFAHAFTTESRWISRKDNVLAMPRVDTIHVTATVEKDAVCQST